MKRTRLFVFLAVVAAHVLGILCLSLSLAAKNVPKESAPQTLELADFQYAENSPAPEESAPAKATQSAGPAPRQETIDPGTESDAAQKKTASDAGAETADSANIARGDSNQGGSGNGTGENSDKDYVPMQKISELPVIAENSVRAKLVYPEMARKAGIEGIVYLELFIDSIGKIRKISVLKETPGGFGFANAAISAFDGCTCVPAKANGQTVSVRFRYPIRFSLN